MESRTRRHIRVRKKVKGTAERPRLCVFRSASHIYAQVIDDTKHATIAAVSSVGKDLIDHEGHRGNIDAAGKLGEIIGKKAADKGIKQVVFDRGGNIYHGRIKALADGARKAGLEF
jgi:large subunit ribosomal protein L18